MRILKAAREATSLEELFIYQMQAHTMARIRRIVLSAVLGITRELCGRFPQNALHCAFWAFAEAPRPLWQSCGNLARSRHHQACARADEHPAFLDLKGRNYSILASNKKPAMTLRHRRLSCSRPATALSGLRLLRLRLPMTRGYNGNHLLRGLPSKLNAFLALLKIHDVDVAHLGRDPPRREARKRHGRILQ